MPDFSPQVGVSNQVGQILPTSTPLYELPTPANGTPYAFSPHVAPTAQLGPPQAIQASVAMQQNRFATGNNSFRPGIPQSVSTQAISTLMSPDATPQHSTAPSVCSPDAGRLTEPRNYAPRTAGLPLYNEPPPRFNLDVIPQAPSFNTQDPFGPAQATGALVHMLQANDTFVAQCPKFDLSPGEIVQVRSAHLNKLTGGHPAGVPTFSVALAEENFPFVRGADLARNDNPRGVVKLKNVSNIPHCHHNY